MRTARRQTNHPKRVWYNVCHWLRYTQHAGSCSPITLACLLDHLCNHPTLVGHAARTLLTPAATNNAPYRYLLYILRCSADQVRELAARPHLQAPGASCASVPGAPLLPRSQGRAS